MNDHAAVTETVCPRHSSNVEVPAKLALASSCHKVEGNHGARDLPWVSTDK